MKTILERLNPKKVAIIVGAIILLLVINRLISNSKGSEEALPEEKTKAVEVIAFGSWAPDSRREITGTLLSGTDIDIQAEVSGNIGQTFVSIGDSVNSGDILAIFESKNDATQISYENLLQQLAVSRIQTAATVQSAETALDVARKQETQTESIEAQNYSRTFSLLETYANNAETTFSDSMAWADSILGVSFSARSNVSTTYSTVGSNDYKSRQIAKNKTEELLREDARIANEIVPYTLSDADVLKIANNRLELLKEAQIVLRMISDMANRTPATSSFTSTTKATIQTTTTTYLAQIETAVYALEGQIEASKSEQGRNRLSVLGVNNAVQQAESALALAKAQAQSQITQLETQIRLARNSQKDLTVRAPFAGKITGKNILAFDQVKAGQILFSMVGTNVKPKLSATITRDELMRVQANLDKVTAELEDGTIIPLPEVKISGKLDPMTQKLKVDFPLEEISESALVGSFVKIMLPIDGNTSNLLPISAISFEPDGAEVLVLEDGVGKRVKIEVGKLVSNAVEINFGLDNGAQVVRHRSRAHAGEKLEIRK